MRFVRQGLSYSSVCDRERVPGPTVPRDFVLELRVKGAGVLHASQRIRQREFVEPANCIRELVQEHNHDTEEAEPDGRVPELNPCGRVSVPRSMIDDCPQQDGEQRYRDSPSQSRRQGD